MTNYKNPSYRISFYKANMKAEPDGASIIYGLYNWAGCFGKMGVVGVLISFLTEIEMMLWYW